MVKAFTVSSLIEEDYIIDLQSDTKESALKELLRLICKSPLITDPKRFEKEIFRREKLMSTGIGYEIAIPHARHSSIKDFVIAIGRQKSGIPYESIDDTPVKLIFLIGASDKQDKDYIKLLSRLVLRLKNLDFKEKLLEVSNPGEMYKLIKEKK